MLIFIIITLLIFFRGIRIPPLYQHYALADRIFCLLMNVYQTSFIRKYKPLAGYQTNADHDWPV
ncbi:hypothetical protein CS542_10415 [Pedobacter sp. IW39]|nr:hypothetical protein CS542_10415 [Pedobacter sp. IW39]